MSPSTWVGAHGCPPNGGHGNRILYIYIEPVMGGGRIIVLNKIPWRKNMKHVNRGKSTGELNMKEHSRK